MEELSLMLGIILMMVAPLGIMLYVALVIAIPVCRTLDWFFNPRTDEHMVRASPPRATRRARSRRLPKHWHWPHWHWHR